MWYRGKVGRVANRQQTFHKTRPSDVLCLNVPFRDAGKYFRSSAFRQLIKGRSRDVVEGFRYQQRDSSRFHVFRMLHCEHRSVIDKYCCVLEVECVNFPPPYISSLMGVIKICREG
jgi:hypothetical protein